jgi:hypothetical protein
MTHVRATLEKCIQDSQEYGSDDAHVVSRVFFTIEAEGQRFAGHVDIKQTGGGGDESGAIEVGAPTGYAGPFNQEVFHRHVTAYFQSCVGSGGSGIRLGAGAKNKRIRNHTFVQPHVFEFEASPSGRAW